MQEQKYQQVEMRSQTQEPEDVNNLEQAASSAGYYDSHHDKDEGLVRHTTNESHPNEQFNSMETQENQENERSRQND